MSDLFLHTVFAGRLMTEKEHQRTSEAKYIYITPKHIYFQTDDLKNITSVLNMLLMVNFTYWCVFKMEVMQCVFETELAYLLEKE